MKKIISAALAAFMAVSALTTAAFAATDPDLKGTSSIALKATTMIPTLKVTLPKSLAFVANPYKMELDKTTGKAATATTKVEGNTEKTGLNHDWTTTDTVVPVYGVTSNKGEYTYGDPEKTGTYTYNTANTAWDVINNSGVALSCSLYAKVTNSNPDKLQILNVNAEDTSTPIDGGATVDQTKKQLGLQLIATPYTNSGSGGASAAGTAVPVTVVATAPAKWVSETASETTGVATITKIDEKLALTLGNKSYAKKGTNSDKWDTKDVATLNVVFNFDFYVSAT